VRSCLHALLVGLAIALCAPASIAAEDTEKAQKNRRKASQRCDELKGDAELECLKKARERVVEARKKREEKAGAEADKREDKAAAGERADKTRRVAADKREPRD
jgi:hypothetical protein